MRTLCIWLLALLAALPAFAQRLDSTFAPLDLRGGMFTVTYAMAVQPDGKVVLGGDFDFADTASAPKVVRLLPNGHVDYTFNPGGTGPNAQVHAIALLPNGQILIGGEFQSYNNQHVSGLARLNADGSLDASFSFLPSRSTQVYSLVVQPDGKIIAGLNSSTNSLTRLLADGTPDPSFIPGTAFNSTVYSLALQPDGKILAAGMFSTYNGAPAKNIARLEANGTLDATFNAGTGANAGARVEALALQPDGKVLVGGTFQQFNGQNNNSLVRLEPSGAIDPSFSSALYGSVNCLRLRSTGQLLVGGMLGTAPASWYAGFMQVLTTGQRDQSFVPTANVSRDVYALAEDPVGNILVTGLYFGNRTGGVRTSVMRYSPTGVFDPSFHCEFAIAGQIEQVGVLPNGKVVVRGQYDQFDRVNVRSRRPQLLHADGTRDAAFAANMPDTTLGAFAVQPDGRIIFTVTSLYTGSVSFVRVFPDGTRDPSFVSQNTISANYAVNLTQLLLQPDGKMLVIGDIAGYGTTYRSAIIRLLPNGSLDNSFVPPTRPSYQQYERVLLQSDGKILVFVRGGGNNMWVDRLLPSGTLDATWVFPNSPTNYTYNSVQLLPDDRLLVLGHFNTSSGQLGPAAVYRFRKNGSLDTTYPLTHYFTLYAAQTDGRVLGNAPAFVTNGSAAGIGRYDTTGAPDAGFKPVAVPNAFNPIRELTGVVIQPADGRLLLYGSFLSVAEKRRMGLVRLTNPGFSGANGLSEDVSGQKLAVWPNPAADRLQVRLPEGRSFRQAVLLDGQGRTVRQWEIGESSVATFNVADLPAGLYMVRLLGAQGVAQQRVVVLR